MNTTAPIPPHFTVLLVFGIFMLGALPPIGLLLIIMAFVVLKSYRSKRRGGRAALAYKAEQKAEREFILAMKSI